ncbi:MAG TPA: glycosyl hydrolase 108 family protein [Acetivibrio sp.]|nr:glycosyl hydrolase 108 family protein [Acetivibrio sp.]
MKDTFEKALQFVLKWEGGYSNNPNDPGGLTIFGISQRSYPKEVAKMNELWKQGKKQEALNIAKEIYRKNYWDKIKGDDLPFPLDFVAFDTAVNMGVGACQQLLSQANGDWKQLLFLRLLRYIRLATVNTKLAIFLQGWANRVAALNETIRKEVK